MIVSNKYLNHKHIPNKGIIQTNKKDIISWDIFGSKLRINKNGWKEIFNYFLSLPNEAYKLKNTRSVWWSFGHSYSYLKLNKDYFKEHEKELIEKVYEILSNDGYFEDASDWTTEINVWEVYPNERQELKDKYNTWKPKKKEKVYKEYNRFKILQRDNFRCKICGRGAPEVNLHIDHWIPKAKGGPDIYSNLVTLCSECNLSKSATMPNIPISTILKNSNERGIDKNE